MLEKSERLKAVVQVIWKCCLDRCIVLKDWDPETVGRFLEWLSTGDYDIPWLAKASKSAPEGNSTLRATEASVFSNLGIKAGPPSTPEFKSAIGPKRPLTPLANICFNKTGSELASPYAEALQQWTTESEAFKSGMDFEASLLAHAKLYALADYMLLPVLQAEVFQCLRILLVFTEALSRKSVSLWARGDRVASKPVMSSIMTLVRYVYAHTTKPESGEEPLRKLVTTFIALHYDQFEDQVEEALRSMEQGGDCRVDIFDKVRRNEFALRKDLLKARRGLVEAIGRTRKNPKPGILRTTMRMAKQA